MPRLPSPDDPVDPSRTPRALEFLGDGQDERFDRLTRLTGRLFDAPIALLSLSDSDHFWVHSRVGSNPKRPPLELSFCTPDLHGDDVLIVPDASTDARFQDHPLVVGLPEIRFYASCPVKGPDGRSLGTLCVIDHEPRDIAQEEVGALEDLAWMFEQELRSLSMAMQDALTGLTNRRGFDEIAAHTIAMCRRFAEPATLLYFDLDDFKGVNDSLGHTAGDRVLKTFARQLGATFRDSDVVARVGGDEFCVLLTSATTKEVERPLSLLEGRLKTRAGEPLVSFSVGVAEYDPDRHKSVRALVHEADLLMYDRKRSGGRRE